MGPIFEEKTVIATAFGVGEESHVGLSKKTALR